MGSALGRVNARRTYKEAIKDAKTAANAIGDGIATVVRPVRRVIESAAQAIYDQARTHDLLSMHTPEELSKLKGEYFSQLGLQGATYSADAFDNLVKSRPVDLNLFKDTKGLNNLSVYEKLSQDSEAAKAVVAEVVKLLKPSDAFSKAHEEYNKAIKDIKKLAEKNATIKPEQLIGLMKEAIDTALDKIKEQHHLEKTTLSNLLDAGAVASPVDAAAQLEADNLSFTKKLTEALGPNAKVNEVDAVKENMKKDLEASHAKQLAEFVKATNETINKLHDANAAQMKQSHFLATMYKNQEDMRKIIDEYLRQHKGQGPNPGPAVVQLHGTNTVNLLGMRIEDLSIIKTVTGKTIMVNKDVNGSLSSFSMEFGGITDSYYRWSSEKRPLADFMTMAHAVRATGKKAISFDLQFNDPETLNLRGREAYEAAIRCGFAADQIEIKLNGKVQKIEELFADHSQTLERLRATSKKIMQRFDEVTTSKPATGRSLELAKSEMAELRNKEAAEAAAAAKAKPDGNEPKAEGVSISAS